MPPGKNPSPQSDLISRFMGLDPNEVGYFISQVGLAAASFGVASSDIQIVAQVLVSYFMFRCAPPLAIVPGDGPQLQPICGDAMCPLSPMPECWLYDDYGIDPEPKTAPQCMSPPPMTMYTSTKSEGYPPSTSSSEWYTSTSTTSMWYPSSTSSSEWYPSTSSKWY